MYLTTTPVPFPGIRPVHGSRIPVTRNEAPTETDRVIQYFLNCEAFRPEGQVASLVRKIFTTPPEALRVSRFARSAHLSRRTLGRRFQAEGVPSPAAWIALARAVRAHRSILRGGSLQDAGTAAGYSDQFTMSNAIHRITGLRPSHLREVSQDGLLATWIDRQRKRGALTGPPPSSPRSCPLCGTLRAS